MMMLIISNHWQSKTKNPHASTKPRFGGVFYYAIAVCKEANTSSYVLATAAGAC